MSSPMTIDSPCVVAKTSDGIQSENEATETTPSDATSAGAQNGSLFRMLTPDLLLLIFKWIGTDDMKAYISLATCSDQDLAHFIYEECKFLWTDLDLAKFPGITDVQLQSLLERINAQCVTKSIVLHKTEDHPGITGAGLEPLRDSRVLESIDLRQSSNRTPGPTGLDDTLVTDILSTMLPHKLSVVKVRQQFKSVSPPFCDYSYAWGSFLSNLKIFHARKRARKSCSHCGMPLTFSGRFEVHSALNNGPSLCTSCNMHSCNFSTSEFHFHNFSCPKVIECQVCLDSFCALCRLVVPCDYCRVESCSECEPNHLSCQSCGNRSCSSCNEVLQCKECGDTGCSNCDTIIACDRCKEPHCDGCIFTTWCEHCGTVVCEAEECIEVFVWCESCDAHSCNACREVARLLECQDCKFCLCANCSGGIYKEFTFEGCSYCKQLLCCYRIGEPSCFDGHDCKSPGELVYAARDAVEGDDSCSLCACGNKHLTSAEGQTFICSWVAKMEEV